MINKDIYVFHVNRWVAETPVCICVSVHYMHVCTCVYLCHLSVCVCMCLGGALFLWEVNPHVHNLSLSGVCSKPQAREGG